MYIKSNKPQPQRSKLLRLFVSVLIVDRDATMRLVLGRTLEREGFMVLQAEGGADAMEQIREKDVDLVIMDSTVSDMSGLELLEKVKGDFPHMPILLITGHHQGTVRALATKEGAMDFIMKPFNNLEILAALRRTAQKIQSS